MNLAVGTRNGGNPSLLVPRHRLASFGRYFPPLPIAGPIGSEINPAPISGPARYHIVGSPRGEAARAPSFCARYVDVRVGFDVSIEGDVPPIGRPARCAGGAVEGSQLDEICAIAIAYPDFIASRPSGFED